MFGIWLFDRQDWLRESVPHTTPGGPAVLAFPREEQARGRAAQHFGFTTYAAVFGHGYCEVRRLPAFALSAA